MKTYKNLYPQIYRWENLETAYRNARKGKRRHQSVADFEYAWESQLLQLQDELVNKTYRPGPYHSFYIHDPKTRLISAAPFRDRVVHHALCLLIDPGQHRHVSQMMDEIGRLLGGWLKSLGSQSQKQAVSGLPQ